MTRWFSSYEMMDWFREQKTAVQMYDIKHGADAAKKANGDAYKANRLQHIDWDIVEQSVAVHRCCCRARRRPSTLRAPRMSPPRWCCRARLRAPYVFPSALRGRGSVI